MAEYKKLWMALVVVLIVGFSFLGFYGGEVYRQSPPVVKFTDASGAELISTERIYCGQEAWQSIGGMQVGSIWGHGAYQAPDWSADWLHKELVAFMDIKAQERFGVKFDALNDEQKAQIKALTKAEYRTNTVKDGTVKLSDDRLKAMAVVKDEYMGVFGNDPRFKKLREDYAMKENTLANEQHRA